MKLLEEALDKLEIPYHDYVIDQFKTYMDGVLEWNEKINLTAIKNHDEFILKHYIDSVLCYSFDEYQDADDVIDIGTGGGFPGIPLAILSPEKDFVLADSLNKRLKVIDTLCEESEIYNVETVHGRAEELGRKQQYRETFDVCVSRAVANLSVLAEYCLPFVRLGGYLLAFKGPEAEMEAKKAEKAIKTLGGKLVRIENVSLDGYEHNICVIEKVKKTPDKYPRKPGTPAKSPL